MYGLERYYRDAIRRVKAGNSRHRAMITAEMARIEHILSERIALAPKDDDITKIKFGVRVNNRVIRFRSVA